MKKTIYNNAFTRFTDKEFDEKYEEFQNIAKGVQGSPYSFEEGQANYLSKEQYEKVMAKISSSTQGKWNGYYILIVLCSSLSPKSFF